MANRNIDESIRKPRRTKGTPFFYQRNYWALGVILFGGVSWYLYEFWPQSQRLKKSIQEGKFKYSPQWQEHRLALQSSNADPTVAVALSKLREKIEHEEEKPRMQPWLSKILTEQPDFSSNKSQISKFFRKNEENTELEIDSPYKNVITEPTLTLNNSLENDNDFKSPKCYKQMKLSKTNESSNKPKIAKKRQTRSNIITRQNRLTDMIKENLAYTDTNPEHLQMALALSKSEQTSTEMDDDIEIVDGSPSKQKRMVGIRPTLEQFGFKSNKLRTRNTGFVKKSKKSKYRFITPILYIRTKEDRQNLITSKISMILSESTLPRYNYEKEKVKITSSYLSNLINEQSKIFNINNIRYEDLNSGVFYTKGLDLERSSAKCGYLLKDWAQIPGRDKTPPREICKSNNLNKITERNVDISLSQKIHLDDRVDGKNIERSYDEDVIIDKNAPRSLSPDLFASDEDEEIVDIRKSIDEKLRSSLEMIDIIKRASFKSNKEQVDGDNRSIDSVQEDIAGIECDTDDEIDKNGNVRETDECDKRGCIEEGNLEAIKSEEIERCKEEECNDENFEMNSIDFVAEIKEVYDKVPDPNEKTRIPNKIQRKISSADSNSYSSSEEELWLPNITTPTQSNENRRGNIPNLYGPTFSSDFSTSITHHDLITDKSNRVNRKKPKSKEAAREHQAKDIITDANCSSNFAVIKDKGCVEELKTITSEDSKLSPLIPTPIQSVMGNTDDDILVNLEIPRLNYVVASASLSGESLDKIDEDVQRSDESDCNFPIENLNGIEHFESFYDEEFKALEQHYHDDADFDRRNSKISGKLSYRMSNDDRSETGLMDFHKSDEIDTSLDPNIDKIYDLTQSHETYTSKPSDFNGLNDIIASFCIDLDEARKDPKITKKIRRKYEILSDSDSDEGVRDRKTSFKKSQSFTTAVPNRNGLTNLKKYSSFDPASPLRTDTDEMGTVRYESLEIKGTIRKKFEKTGKSPSRSKNRTFRRSLSFTNSKTIPITNGTDGDAPMSYESPEIRGLFEKSIRCKNEETQQKSLNDSFTTTTPPKRFARKSSFPTDFTTVSPLKYAPYRPFTNLFSSKPSNIDDDNDDNDGVVCISDEELNYSSKLSTPSGKSDTREGDDRWTYSYLEKYYDDHFYPFDGISQRSPIAHPRITELTRRYSSKSPFAEAPSSRFNQKTFDPSDGSNRTSFFTGDPSTRSNQNTFDPSDKSNQDESSRRSFLTRDTSSRFNQETFAPSDESNRRSCFTGDPSTRSNQKTFGPSDKSNQNESNRRSFLTRDTSSRFNQETFDPSDESNRSSFFTGDPSTRSNQKTFDPSDKSNQDESNRRSFLTRDTSSRFNQETFDPSDESNRSSCFTGDPSPRSNQKTFDPSDKSNQDESYRRSFLTRDTSSRFNQETFAPSDESNRRSCFTGDPSTRSNQKTFGPSDKSNQNESNRRSFLTRDTSSRFNQETFDPSDESNRSSLFTGDLLTRSNQKTFHPSDKPKQTSFSTEGLASRSNRRTFDSWDESNRKSFLTRDTSSRFKQETFDPSDESNRSSLFTGDLSTRSNQKTFDPSDKPNQTSFSTEGPASRSDQRTFYSWDESNRRSFFTRDISSRFNQKTFDPSDESNRSSLFTADLSTRSNQKTFHPSDKSKQTSFSTEGPASRSDQRTFDSWDESNRKSSFPGDTSSRFNQETFDPSDESNRSSLFTGINRMNQIEAPFLLGSTDESNRRSFFTRDTSTRSNQKTFDPSDKSKQTSFSTEGLASRSNRRTFDSWNESNQTSFFTEGPSSRFNQETFDPSDESYRSSLFTGDPSTRSNLKILNPSNRWDPTVFLKKDESDRKIPSTKSLGKNLPKTPISITNNKLDDDTSTPDGSIIMKLIKNSTLHDPPPDNDTSTPDRSIIIKPTRNSTLNDPPLHDDTSTPDASMIMKLIKNSTLHDPPPDNDISTPDRSIIMKTTRNSTLNDPSLHDDTSTPDASMIMKLIKNSTLHDPPPDNDTSTPDRSIIMKTTRNSTLNDPPPDNYTSTPDRSIIMKTIKNPTVHDTPRDDNASTPDGSLVIKTRNVTPMPDYDNMETPKLMKELEKIGVKQLKRHRSVQILKHVYEVTHPICTDPRTNPPEQGDGDNLNVKRRKLTREKSKRKLDIDSNDGFIREDEDVAMIGRGIEVVGDIPESEDLIFERHPSKKIPSCALPLHIAWHNLILTNLELKQNILLYEPLQLEALYAMLKGQGYKYHIQDLLTFLDKKCITIRTNQNNRRPRQRF